ncbi:MAG TPA: rhodanese-like domain-containing protein [Gammaproteobacteria bacterium]|nr:rhodanese-like domain-containing protein [Gammaproteobacteria bacterium]
MAQLAEHVVNHPVLVAALVAMLVVVAVYELRHQTVVGGFGVSAADAVRLINKGATVIDLRKPEAFQEGHIVNARNIALEQVTSDRSIAKRQKNKVFITVCDTGALSGRAATALRKAGFENAFSLRGGIKKWRDDNLPLVK